jgi:hypothetical protein
MPASSVILSERQIIEAALGQGFDEDRLSRALMHACHQALSEYPRRGLPQTETLLQGVVCAHDLPAIELLLSQLEVFYEHPCAVMGEGVIRTISSIAPFLLPRLLHIAPIATDFSSALPWVNHWVNLDPRLLDIVIHRCQPGPDFQSGLAKALSASAQAGDLSTTHALIQRIEGDKVGVCTTALLMALDGRDDVPWSQCEPLLRHADVDALWEQAWALKTDGWVQVPTAPRTIARLAVLWSPARLQEAMEEEGHAWELCDLAMLEHAVLTAHAPTPAVSRLAPRL